MIKVSLNPEQDLKDYTSFKLKLTPIMNILINDRSKDWYYEIGKYLVEKTNGNLKGNLSFFNDKLKFNFIERFNGKDKRTLESIGIFALTDIDKKILKMMWGNPIFHSEFGEGLSKKSKSTFASYFIEINGYKFHIGYDHRGTSIEPDESLKPSELFECLKILIDEIIINW